MLVVTELTLKTLRAILFGRVQAMWQRRQQMAEFPRCLPDQCPEQFRQFKSGTMTILMRCRLALNTLALMAFGEPNHEHAALDAR